MQCDEHQQLKGRDDFPSKVHSETAGSYKAGFMELDQFKLTSQITNERKDVFRKPEFIGGLKQETEPREIRKVGRGKKKKKVCHPSVFSLFSIGWFP